MEKTIYMIKPEGMIHKHEIREIVESRNLVIVERKTLILPDWALDILYPDLSIELKMATLTMLASVVEIGLVEGNQAVKVLFALAGAATAPADCDTNSIRFRFGKKDPIQFGSVMYYANVIHRPKSLIEARRDVELFHRLP